MMNESRTLPNFPLKHRVWCAGKEAMLYVHPFLEPTRTETGKYRNTRVYLVAPVDVNAAQDDAHDDPPFIPQHDEVIETALGGYDERANPLGFYATRGANANDENVHSRLDPRGASGSPMESGVIELVYEINLGEGFVPLRDANVIEQGVARGLIELKNVPTPPHEEKHNGSCWVAE